MSTAIVTTFDTEKEAEFIKMLEDATPEKIALTKEVLIFVSENDVDELDDKALEERFAEWKDARDNEQFNREREEARATYRRHQDNIANLNKKDKELFDRISAFKTPDRYDMRTNELLMVAGIYENNAVNAGNTLFKYGFIKGIRYAKKQLKRGMQRA